MKMSQLDGKRLATLHGAAPQLHAVYSCIANFCPRLRARFRHHLLQASRTHFGKRYIQTLCKT